MYPVFRIVIIYGSQTGNACGIAEKLAVQCCKILRLRNFPADSPTSLVHLCEANSYVPLKQLAKETGPVIFVCSTTGFGDPPDNMASFWRKLMNIRLPEGKTFPISLRFAVLGIGDSSYKHYNFVAKKLYRRMVHLGASPLPVSMALGDADQDIGLGLADESAPESIVTCLQRFVPSLWNTILNHYSMYVQPIGSIPLPITWEGLESSEFIASLQPRFMVRRVRKIDSGDVNLINGNHYRNNELLMDMIETTIARDSALFKMPAMPSEAGWFVVKSNERITPSNYFQETRLIELEAGNGASQPEFLPGTVLKVQPINLTEDVLAFFKVTGLDPNVRISIRSFTKEIHPGQHIVSFSLPGRLESVCASDGISLAWLAAYYFDISSIPTRSFFSDFAAAHKWRPTGTKDDERVAMEYDRLKELGQARTPEEVDDFYDYVNRPRRNIIEVLGDFPCTTSFIPAEQWINILPGPLRPRPYSIASASPKIELLIAVVTYRTRMLTPRRGLASTYLARCKVGTRIPAWISRLSYGFDFSYHLTSSVPRPPPCVLICTGTGVAPLRAFIQYQRKSFPRAFNVLVFGCRFSHRDFYFEKEWKCLEGDDSLQLITAFSRECGKITTAKNRTYVQHKIRENPDLVWSVLGEAQGSVFIAGNARTMPLAVREAIVEIAQTGGGLSAYEAETFVNNLESSGRYQAEVWIAYEMSAFKEGVLFGLRECLNAPLSLLLIRRKLLKMSSSKSRRGSVTDSPTQGYYDQALLRRKVSEAMGKKPPAVTHPNPPNNSSSSSKDVLYALCWIWFINLVVVLVMATFLYIINRFLDTSVGRFLWSFVLIQWPLWALGYIVQTSTFLITEIVNSVCLKTICMQTESVKHRSTTGDNSGNRHSSLSNLPTSARSFGLGVKLMDYSYSIVFFLIYSLQWRLLASMVPYPLVRSVFKTCTLSLIYACYAFDFYARQKSDVNVEALLLHIANYWPVFMGYGLPLGFLVTLSGNWYFTGDLLVSFLYPILVIGAFQISWSKVLDPKHRVSPCLRDLAVISMKPALFITNTIVSITASIGLGFMSP